MENLYNNINKERAFMMKSLLGNKDTAKIFQDAFDSPVGSTKRKIASSMLASLEKTAKRKRIADGQGGIMDTISGLFGGPAVQMPTWQSVSTPKPAAQPKPAPQPFIGPLPQPAINQPNVTLFPSASIPKQKTLTFDPRDTAFSAIDEMMSSKRKETMISEMDELMRRIEENNKKMEEQYKASSQSNLAPLTSKYEWQEERKPSAPVGQMPSQFQQDLYNLRNKAVTNIVNPVIRGPGLIAEGAESLLKSAYGGLKDAASYIKDKAVRAYEKPGEVLSDYFGAKYPSPSMPGQPLLSPEVKDILANTKLEPSKLQPSSTKEKKETKLPDGSIITETVEKKDSTSSQEGIVYDPQNKITGNSSVGGSVTGTGDIPSGIETLDKESPSSTANIGLTTGGVPSLSTGGDDFERQLREALDLDKIKADRDKLVSMGPNLQRNSEEWIRSNDQHVARINKMMKDAKENFSKNGDPSNPQQVRAHEMYLKTLQGLKAAQNERYDDYVKRTIDEYNADLRAAEELYKTTTTAYSDAIKSHADMKKEAYKEQMDLYKTMLKYEIERPEREARLDSLKMDILKKEADLVKSGIDNVFSKDSIEAMKKAGEIYWDKDGNIIKGLNVGEEFAVWSNKDTAVPMKAQLSAIETGMKNRLRSEAKSPENILGSIKNFSGDLLNIFMVETTKQPYAFDEEGNKVSIPLDFRESLGVANRVLTQAGDILIEYMRDNAETVRPYEILSQLEKGTTGTWWKTALTRNKFIQANSNYLPADILDAIYNAYEVDLSRDPKLQYTENIQARIKDLGGTPDTHAATVLGSMVTDQWNSALLQSVQKLTQ